MVFVGSLINASVRYDVVDRSDLVINVSSKAMIQANGCRCRLGSASYYRLMRSIGIRDFVSCKFDADTVCNIVRDCVDTDKVMIISYTGDPIIESTLLNVTTNIDYMPLATNAEILKVFDGNGIISDMSVISRDDDLFLYVIGNNGTGVYIANSEADGYPTEVCNLISTEEITAILPGWRNFESKEDLFNHIVIASNCKVTEINEIVYRSQHIHVNSKTELHRIGKSHRIRRKVDCDNNTMFDIAATLANIHPVDYRTRIRFQKIAGSVLRYWKPRSVFERSHYKRRRTNNT